MSLYEYERTLSKLETAISDADYPQEWKTLLLNFENALFAEVRSARLSWAMCSFSFVILLCRAMVGMPLKGGSVSLLQVTH